MSSKYLYDIEEDHKHELDSEKKPPPFDLKQYVYITDDGRRYLKTLSDLDLLEK